MTAAKIWWQIMAQRFWGKLVLLVFMALCTAWTKSHSLQTIIHSCEVHASQPSFHSAGCDGICCISMLQAQHLCGRLNVDIKHVCESLQQCHSIALYRHLRPDTVLVLCAHHAACISCTLVVGRPCRPPGVMAGNGCRSRATFRANP